MSAALIAPVAAVLILAAIAALLAAQRWWQRRLIGTVLAGTAAGGGETEVPDILYFTGPNCTVCHVAQRPALGRLRDAVPDVAVSEIDVSREPATARRYRVMTLPTTVVLDRAGRTTAVNIGYASEAVLGEQVEAARAAALATALA